MKPTARFSSLLMSNTKWRRFFSVAAEIPAIAKWKLVDESSPTQGGMPQPPDVWETSVDNCLNGPVEYRDIEWIHLPSRVEYRKHPNALPSYHQQPLHELFDRLESIGKVPIEQQPDGATIYGYKR